jgi:hypothetical protein
MAKYQPGTWNHLIPSVEGKESIPFSKMWQVVDREKLRKLCEEIYGVGITPEAAAYFARLMARFIVGFKGYLPVKRDSKPLTVEDIYQAASRYFA